MYFITICKKKCYCSVNTRSGENNMPLGSSKIAVNKNRTLGVNSGGTPFDLVVSVVETLTNSHTVNYAVTTNLPNITLSFKIETNLTGLDFQNGSVNGTVPIDGTSSGSFDIQLLDGFASPINPQFRTNITRGSTVLVEGDLHTITALQPVQISGARSKKLVTLYDAQPFPLPSLEKIYQVADLTNTLNSPTDTDITMNITSLGDYSGYTGNANLEMQVVIVGGGGGTNSANTSLPTFVNGTYTYEPWKFLGLNGGGGGNTLRFDVPLANLSVGAYNGTIGKGGAAGTAGTNYLGGDGGNTTFLGNTVEGGYGVQIGQTHNGNTAYAAGNGAPEKTVTGTTARAGGGGGGGAASGTTLGGSMTQGYPNPFNANQDMSGARYYYNGGEGPGIPDDNDSGGWGSARTTGALGPSTSGWFYDNVPATAPNLQLFFFGVGGNGSAFPGDAAGLANRNFIWRGTYNVNNDPKTGIGFIAGLYYPRQPQNAYGQGGSATTTQGSSVSNSDGDDLLTVTVTPSVGNNGTIQVRYPYFTPSRSIDS
jgi:hypothetical protein